MTIIGFNFTKISCVKHNAAKGKITVNRKANPTNVEEVSIGSGQKALKYAFEFGVDYQPKIAEMDMAGDITQLVSPEQSEDILKMWKEQKQLPPKTLEDVMNAILDRCHVQALMMSRELNVPPPFNLPRVKVQEKTEE
jgi:hypothetical protein